MLVVIDYCKFTFIAVLSRITLILLLHLLLLRSSDLRVAKDIRLGIRTLTEHIPLSSDTSSFIGSRTMLFSSRFNT